MENLRLLLVQNQNNLDKLKNRARYTSSYLNNAELDTHRQYGPYSSFWDEWLDLTNSMMEDVNSDLAASRSFVLELREFIICLEASETETKVLKQRETEMESLAREALECQADMLSMADKRILEHKEFTHKLLLVEAIDSLNDE